MGSSPADAVVEGEVLSRKTDGTETRPFLTQLGPIPGGPDISQPVTPDVPSMYMPGQGTIVDGSSSVDYVALEQKARAVSLFLKIPFFAYCALHPELPGLVRLGAAMLGVMEARELYLSRGEISALIPDGLQGY